MTRRRIWQIVEAAHVRDRASRAFDSFIIALILLNTAALVLETVEPVHRRFESGFLAFEVFSVAVFSVEYLLRLWSCVEDPRYARPLAGRLRFAITPMAVIDLLAILPSLLPLIGVDLRSLRMLRIIRFVRLAKLGRYSTALQSFGRVVVAKREELVVSLSLLLILLLVAGTLMYYAEHEAQPEAFSSIPAACWWGIATLTTVGYGDVYPITPIGRLLGSCIAIIGIGFFALPTGILSAAFVEEMSRRSERPRTADGTDESVGDA